MTAPAALFNDGDGSARVPSARGRAGRTLAVCLCASIALHAAAVVLLPADLHEAEPSRARVMAVTLLPPQPLPVAPPEPERLQEVRRAPPPRAESLSPVRTRPDSPAQVLALPEPPVSAESTPATLAPRPEEPPAQPVPKAQAAGATPPVLNAAYLRNPAPRYPLAARRAGEQGTVTVRVLVTPDGRAARVDLERSSGSSHLDAAALEAVRGWRFTPARRGAEAMEEWVLVPIVFRLEGAS